MLLCIQTKDGSAIVPVMPETGENGLVPIFKVQNLRTGKWELRYGPHVLRITDDETSMNTVMTNLMTHINSRTANSAKKVSDIEFLS
jgi:hypothetical protein